MMLGYSGNIGTAFSFGSFWLDLIAAASFKEDKSSQILQFLCSCCLVNSEAGHLMSDWPWCFSWMPSLFYLIIFPVWPLGYLTWYFWLIEPNFNQSIQVEKGILVCLLHALESPDPGISLEERNLGGHLPCLSLNKKHPDGLHGVQPIVELRPSKCSFDKKKKKV